MRPRALGALGSITTLILVCGALGASAQTPILAVPDVTQRLGPVLPATLTDQRVGHDDAAGSVAPQLAGLAAALPASVEIGCLDVSKADRWLVCLDTTTTLPGLATPAEPRDVVEYDPVTGGFSLFFDGSASGVPRRLRIDGLAFDAADLPLFSFDTSALLPGAGLVDDEDVVSFAAGSFALVFDGSASGIAPALDVDGLDRSAADQLLVSFDATGLVGAISFDDEDVLAFDAGAGSFAMHFDGSLSDPLGWPAVDLVAVPEASAIPMLWTGALVVATCAQRRSRGTRERRQAMGR